jgi:hypothetical protein
VPGSVMRGKFLLHETSLLWLRWTLLRSFASQRIPFHMAWPIPPLPGGNRAIKRFGFFSDNQDEHNYVPRFATPKEDNKWPIAPPLLPTTIGCSFLWWSCYVFLPISLSSTHCFVLPICPFHLLNSIFLRLIHPFLGLNRLSLSLIHLCPFLLPSRFFL